MLKKIKKKVIYWLISFFIIIGLILLILFIFEKIYSQSDEVKWTIYNDTVNQMNRDKLSNWDWDEEKYIWEYKDKPLTKKGEKKRILIVGDSYVWGDGYVNANHIWWQQLRNKLLESGYNDVELVAMGLSGYNTKQQHNMLIKTNVVENINPDLIIFSYVMNDIEAWQNPYDDNLIWSQAKVDYDVLSDILPSGVNFVWSSLFPNLYGKANLMLTDKYSNSNKALCLSYIDYESKIHSEIFMEKYLENIIEPLKKYLENDIGVPYFFVNIPYYASSDSVEKINKIQNLFETVNIDFYNLETLYIDNVGMFDSAIYNINPSNGHPGTKTTEFSARKVLEYLEANYSAILGTKGQVLMNEIIINDPMPRSINLNKIDNYTFEFIYPSKKSKNSFLNMPIEKDYIKLNFMYPVDLKSMEITGENIKDIDVYINKINEFGYDDQKMYKLDSETKHTWNINTKKVTSINISANIKSGKSSKMTIKFVKE